MSICGICETFRTHWLRMGLLLGLAVFLVMGAIDVASGGKSTIPPGVIYFRHDGAMWRMDAAGTPASRVALATVRDWGQPSYARHSGQRWFVYEEGGLIGQHPTFPNGRIALAIRADSEGGQDVLLLSDPDIEVISPPIWSVGDTSVTFIGERWELDENGDPTNVVEAGFYELNIDFSSGAPAAGTLNFLADLSGPMGVGLDAFDADGFISHSWNSDGTKCVFNVTATNEDIWIVNLAIVSDPSAVPVEAFQLIASGNVSAPIWSPDGSRIGYYSSNGTVVYEVATGRTKVLKRTAIGHYGATVWSPSGSHFVAYHWDNMLPGEDAIYRFTSDLGGKTELTAGLSNPLPAFNVLIPVGWRE